MEMEVVVAVAPPAVVDFNFDSNCSSPYMTAPSSPQRFGNFFFSAPTSPTRVSSFLHQLNDLAVTHSSASSSSSSSSSVPFHWEQQPGIPKSNATPQHSNNNNYAADDDDDDDGDDFEFNFSGHLERPSLSADELFDGGKIRPLKPPPRLQSIDGVATSPSVSPRSRISQGMKAFSPKKRDNFDPFAAALEETRRREEEEEEKEPKQQQEEQKRGRERASASQSFAGRKGSRSMSPLRVSDIVCEPSEDKGVASSASNSNSNNAKASYASSLLSSIPFTRGYRKWRLRDFLLFRSASEGRATDKDPLMMRKYEVLSKKAAEDIQDARNSSFRSTDSSGSVSKRRGPVSAHELHYTLNRAASEELKKRTFLPYKSGLLGCLGFNPGGGMHEISRGFGSLTRS